MFETWREGVSSTVTMTHWTSKYHFRHEFLEWFLNEQDYIDNEFIWLIYANFGVMLKSSDLLSTTLT
jgi:hypothetical protein